MQELIDRHEISKLKDNELISLLLDMSNTYKELGNTKDSYLIDEAIDRIENKNDELGE